MSASDPLFDSGVRTGLIIIVVIASLSATAVSSLLAFIGYSVVTIKKGATRKWHVSTHVHYYFVNLLVCDLTQAIGSIMNVKWVVESRVVEGPLCTTQGIIKQIADVGVALSTLSMAIHTCLVLVFRFYLRPELALFVIAGIWVFIVLIIGISAGVHRGENYYGSTQYWCWITDNFDTERIALEYLWVWTTAVLNIVCYILIALMIRGAIVVNGHKISFRHRSAIVETFHRVNNPTARRSKTLAVQMLFYPAVYIATVTPVSVVRWLEFGGTSVPFSATAFASVCFSCSGIFNVILFSVTRPGIVPIRGLTNSDERDGESHGTVMSPIPSSKPPVSPRIHEALEAYEWVPDTGPRKGSNITDDSRDLDSVFYGVK